MLLLEADLTILDPPELADAYRELAATALRVAGTAPPA